jgi:hypothetical protein
MRDIATQAQTFGKPQYSWSERSIDGMRELCKHQALASNQYTSLTVLGSSHVERSRVAIGMHFGLPKVTTITRAFVKISHGIFDCQVGDFSLR